MGRTALYWWPDNGWQRCTVARLCPPCAFSPVVAYNRHTLALRGTPDTLLDAASYSSRWVLLAGPGGGCGPGPSTQGSPTLSLSWVGGSSQLPALGLEVNGHSRRMLCTLHLAVCNTCVFMA